MNLILDCGVEFGDDFLRSIPVTRPTRPLKLFFLIKWLPIWQLLLFRSTGWLHWKMWGIASKLDQRVVDEVHGTGKRTDLPFSFFVLSKVSSIPNIWNISLGSVS
jgi:hypothetical protein